jgi:hypothetical protein
MALGFILQTREDEMKTAITALSALIVATPVVLAQNVSGKAPSHHASTKHHRVVSAAQSPKQPTHVKGYPGAFGNASTAPKDYTYENSSVAGGGGGGGGSGM